MLNAWILALRSRLSVRLVASSLAVLILVQAVVLFVLTGTIRETALERVNTELSAADSLWRRELTVNAERLRLTAAVLAADYAFREAAGTNDMATIESALLNHGGRAGATVTALLSPRFQTRAAAGMIDQTAMSALLETIAQPLSRDAEGTGLALVNCVPFQFVMVPMRAPILTGWVLMGFPVQQELVDGIRRTLGVHVALGDAHAAGERTDVNDQGRHVVLSTLDPQDQASLSAAGFQSGRLRSSQGEMVIRRAELKSLNGDIHTALLRSVDEVTAPYERMTLTLILITVAGVGLFAVSSNLLARRLTRPLQQLEQASERLEGGDFSQRLDPSIAAQPDEIGNLGRAFELMRISVSRQQQEIRELAYSDRLTSLPNRVMLREKLAAELRVQRGEVRPLCLVVLDLNRFKHVNDVLGFAFGDRLLSAVAVRLKSLMAREADLLARLGGNEFAVMLPQCDVAGARIVARRIEQALDLPFSLEDQTIDLSASIGIACFPQHGRDADTLIGHGEVAMFAAKARSSETLVYDPAMDSSSSQTLSLLSELRTAVDDNQLRLFLQPKVGLRNQAVVGAEALVRWQHPQRGLVPPMQFIPFAEQTGFIRKLTLWIFEAVASQWEELQRASGTPLKVSINLSTRDLLDIDLPSKLGAILSRYQLAPERICLEITESAIMDDPARAEGVLNHLAQMGFKLSIDDFGTGYSSLAYLKRLPVNELKIDKSFVMGMEKDRSDEKIVRSTIDLAHNLGLTVVAEGIENVTILERLAAFGCDEAQGYYISKPMPASEFAAWLQGWDVRTMA